MALSTQTKQTQEITPNPETVRTSYCKDCLYNWCKLRDKVTHCTMKTKGFFECKNCMKKLS
ncbi:MAG: hypothetical protein U9O98_10540 [Asgard group archaeon]|nr:hypothetical protein [Asgard group archaeon]